MAEFEAFQRHVKGRDLHRAVWSRDDGETCPQKRGRIRGAGLPAKISSAWKVAGLILAGSPAPGRKSISFSVLCLQHCRVHLRRDLRPRSGPRAPSCSLAVQRICVGFARSRLPFQQSPHAHRGRVTSAPLCPSMGFSVLCPSTVVFISAFAPECCLTHLGNV